MTLAVTVRVTPHTYGGLMPIAATFEDLRAWQSARELTRDVYQLTRTGDFSRDFALRDQMRRAAVSVMSNIAEGFESRTRGLFVDFLGRAMGSSGEVRAQAYVALDAGYLTADQFAVLCSRAASCSRQLNKLMAAVNRHSGT